jgi:hypothetical protein
MYLAIYFYFLKKNLLHFPPSLLVTENPSKISLFFNFKLDFWIYLFFLFGEISPVKEKKYTAQSRPLSYGA